MFDFDALLWRHRPPSAPAGRTREGNSDLRISACYRNCTTVEESKGIEKDAEIICIADGWVQRDFTDGQSDCTSFATRECWWSAQKHLKEHMNQQTFEGVQSS